MDSLSLAHGGVLHNVIICQNYFEAVVSENNFELDGVHLDSVQITPGFINRCRISHRTISALENRPPGIESGGFVLASFHELALHLTHWFTEAVDDHGINADSLKVFLLSDEGFHEFGNWFSGDQFLLLQKGLRREFINLESGVPCERIKQPDQTVDAESIPPQYQSRPMPRTEAMRLYGWDPKNRQEVDTFKQFSADGEIKVIIPEGASLSSYLIYDIREFPEASRSKMKRNPA